MKRKRHTPEEIIRKLRDAETQLAAGAAVADCKGSVTSKPRAISDRAQTWELAHASMTTRHGGRAPQNCSN